MKNSNIVALLAVVVLVVAAIAYLSMGKAGPKASALPAVEVTAQVPEEASASTSASTSPSAAQAPVRDLAAKAARYPKAKEIVAPSGFVNTGGKPVTLGQYVGKKVILLDIMTYSCINCIRTFPYLVDWYKKYEDKGLVIIGIHTPEFDFEKVQANVEAAMAKYGITFPVVLDNDYGTWSAYKNLYWPRKYLIDIDGYVVYDHIGEGGYAETEEKIQELLKERADVLGASVSVDMPKTAGGQPPVAAGQTPETYLGAARGDQSHGWSISGWDVQPQYIESKAAGATISYPVAAKNIYLVASAEAPTKLDVSIDGKPAGAVEVGQARLYDIYKGEGFGPHRLVLTAQGKGLRAFAFTFGN